MTVNKRQPSVESEITQFKGIFPSTTEWQHNAFHPDTESILEHLVPHLTVEGDYLHVRNERMIDIGLRIVLPMRYARE